MRVTNQRALVDLLRAQGRDDSSALEVLAAFEVTLAQMYSDLQLAYQREAAGVRNKTTVESVHITAFNSGLACRRRPQNHEPPRT